MEILKEVNMLSGNGSDTVILISEEDSSDNSLQQLKDYIKTLQQAVPKDSTGMPWNAAYSGFFDQLMKYAETLNNASFEEVRHFSCYLNALFPRDGNGRIASPRDIEQANRQLIDSTKQIPVSCTETAKKVAKMAAGFVVAGCSTMMAVSCVIPPLFVMPFFESNPDVGAALRLGLIVPSSVGLVRGTGNACKASYQLGIGSARLQHVLDLTETATSFYRQQRQTIDECVTDYHQSVGRRHSCDSLPLSR
jgi:hypothetical protein